MEGKRFDQREIGLLHGGDYNPDQWLDRPDILEEDIRLMKQAHVNCVSLGIFAWAALEPEEGDYRLDWLAAIVEQLYANGIRTILATPSGARPAWMAQRYPEVLRVAPDLTRNHMGGRHNHCFTSPVYREKVRGINRRLSQALGGHPGVILWHLSNEYGGECFCPLCQQAFRDWLQRKYGTLEALNQAWWNAFWSHTYTDWSQVEAPVPKGERDVHGLVLDWRRFVTDQTLDFVRQEIAAVREGGSSLPVTTNLMTWFPELNYFKFKDVLDVFSWDAYPEWHRPGQSETVPAVETACYHDLIRSIGQKPFLLMESTPSAINWRPVSKLKKPGMHMLSSLQAVAHGSDSVQYFQWRKSRGSSEKHHGAVVSHNGRGDTRVFRDVARLGARLEGLSALVGSMPRPRVAILYDWENQWALDETRGPRNGGLHYRETVLAHYRAFWQMGVPVDVVDMECPLEGYDLIAAPLLYLYRGGIEGKLRAFVERGGTLVGGCFSGVVDENDLCFQGDTPRGMTDVFGLRAEEVDGLYDGEENSLCWQGRTYRLGDLCERIHPDSARTLAVYGRDFYAGEPVLCVNGFGKGKAYYLASMAEESFYGDFYRALAGELGLERALRCDLPPGVTAARRVLPDTGEAVAFLQNFNNHPVSVALEAPARDLETGEEHRQALLLEAFAVRLMVQS